MEFVAYYVPSDSPEMTPTLLTAVQSKLENVLITLSPLLTILLIVCVPTNSFHIALSLVFA